MLYSTPMPKHHRPIFIIGAGGIVNDAHLPAYRIAGFEVAGIYDINPPMHIPNISTFLHSMDTNKDFCFIFSQLLTCFLQL